MTHYGNLNIRIIETLVREIACLRETSDAEIIASHFASTFDLMPLSSEQLRNLVSFVELQKQNEDWEVGG